MFEDDYGFAYLSHVIVSLTIENMVFCAVGVFIVLLIFIDLRIAIFCFIVVAMIDVCFIGWMLMLGLSLDPITYACLVMAVGLTVDYIIHITHAISHAEPKNKYDYTERLSIAMREMGGSVFKGAITTLLGGLPLLFSTSKGFVLFYAMISGIVLCAFLHGILLVPALLGEFPFIYEMCYDGKGSTMDNLNELISKTSISVSYNGNKSIDDDQIVSKDKEMEMKFKQ